MAYTHRQLFQKFMAPTSDAPLALEITRAEGVYLYDSSGKSYIDLISGIAVSNVGHRNPAVVKAIKDQVDAYMHLMVYGEYIQSPQVKLAEALVKSTGTPHLNQVYFTNSGTEAVVIVQFQFSTHMVILTMELLKILLLIYQQILLLLYRQMKMEKNY